MPVVSPQAKARIMDKLRTALDALKKRVPKANLPRLEALRVYINKMKPRDPNAPRKINYHGGVFKLAKIARWNPPYRTSQDSERHRMKRAWEEGVKGARRPGK